MTEDLDRLLNRAEMRGNLPVGEIRPLIERVKEAEGTLAGLAAPDTAWQRNAVKKDLFSAINLLRRTNKTLESRLRAAEEVLRVVRATVDQAEPSEKWTLTYIEDALQHYDEAVGRVKE